MYESRMPPETSSGCYFQELSATESNHTKNSSATGLFSQRKTSSLSGTNTSSLMKELGSELKNKPKRSTTIQENTAALIQRYRESKGILQCNLSLPRYPNREIRAYKSLALLYPDIPDEPETILSAALSEVREIKKSRVSSLLKRPSEDTISNPAPMRQKRVREILDINAGILQLEHRYLSLTQATSDSKTKLSRNDEDQIYITGGLERLQRVEIPLCMGKTTVVHAGIGKSGFLVQEPSKTQTHHSSLLPSKNAKPFAIEFPWQESSTSLPTSLATMALDSDSESL